MDRFKINNPRQLVFSVRIASDVTEADFVVLDDVVE